jgi:hypothetical protein
MKKSGLDNDPNSIFRASRTVRNIINKKLKEEKDAQDTQQQTLVASPTSSTETDVSKNFSLFTLTIKQIGDVVDSFVDYILTDLNLEDEREFVGNADVDEIKEANKEWRNETKRRKEEEEARARGGSRASQRRGRLGSSAHSDPWNRDVRTLSHDSDVSSSTGFLSSNYSSGGESDSDSDSDVILSDVGDGDDWQGPDINFNFEDDDDISGLTSSLSKDKSNKTITSARDINKIAVLTQYANALWEDNISPNINYLPKIKLNNFLHSQTIEDFEHSIVGLDFLFTHDLIKDNYPEIHRISSNISTLLDNLFDKINMDIKRVAGIQTGTVNGAGFLHLPTPYNSYLQHSAKKYLM